MYRRLRHLHFSLLILANGLLTGCNGFPPKPPVLVLQPFRGFPPALTDSVYAQVRRVYSRTNRQRPVAPPPWAYYAPRHRYRADSLLRFLVGRHRADTVVVGLTHHDISTTKNGRPDWGVLGLGYQPGRACVISSFRLARRNLSTQFYKVVLHELGHTQGLAHCPAPTCFMRDAAGGNPTNQETGFCPRCTTHLRRRGWQLPPAS